MSGSGTSFRLNVLIQRYTARKRESVSQNPRALSSVKQMPGPKASHPKERVNPCCRFLELKGGQGTLP
jgi:hypothetical protein